MRKNLKWKRAIINISCNINEAIKKLEFAEVQILMVVRNNKKFVGTITDGDVRRGLIKGINLEDKIDRILNFNPIVAPPGTDINTVKDIIVNTTTKLVDTLSRLRSEVLKQFEGKVVFKPKKKKSKKEAN